jgi:hypothetical protein
MQYCVRPRGARRLRCYGVMFSQDSFSSEKQLNSPEESKTQIDARRVWYRAYIDNVGGGSSDTGSGSGLGGDQNNTRP